MSVDRLDAGPRDPMPEQQWVLLVKRWDELAAMLEDDSRHRGLDALLERMSRLKADGTREEVLVQVEDGGESRVAVAAFVAQGWRARLAMWRELPEEERGEMPTLEDVRADLLELVEQTPGWSIEGGE